MKSIKTFLIGIFVTSGLIVGLHLLHAQEMAMPVQGGAISAVDWHSASDLQVMLQAVEMLPAVSADSLPRFGTFYSAQHSPGSPEPWPPLPGNARQLPVWNLGDNVFLLSDLNENYSMPLMSSRMVGGRMMMADDGFPLPNGYTNIATPSFDLIAPDYGTNLWIAQVGISSGYLTGILSNSQADVEYEIQSLTDLTQAGAGWNSEGFIYGSELTNWTPFSVPQNGRTNLFLFVRSWQDDGSGLPLWWQEQYFGTNGVNPYGDPAGDGYNNLQKFQMGLNPTNYYNPNAPAGFFGCLDATGTNVFIEWSSSPGPVINYLIQRGIYNNDTGNYDYSQFLVNSNATYFEDVGAISNDNAWDNVYSLLAVYPGGTLTATDTWYAWYAEYGLSDPPYGAPTPNNVYAYADSTGTNVLLSWTAPTRGAAPTNYIIERGIYDPDIYDYVFSQIASVNTNTTCFQDVGVINNDNDWNDIYEVEAVFTGGVPSQPATAFINTTPPGPTGLTAVVDSTGTNVLLSWIPPQGIVVSNYIIERGVYNPSAGNYSFSPIIRITPAAQNQSGGSYGYSQIGQVNGGTTSFVDAGAITGNNSYYNVYRVEAVYPGGGASEFDSANLPGPPAVLNDNIYLTAYLVRNGTGRWQVMFSGLPANSAQTIQLTWTDGNDNATPQSISTTNLTNGIYSIADTDVVNLLGDSLSVQLFGPNGEPGQVVQAGVLANDAPYFVDGRQHLKQNLNFLIRAASIYQPYGATYYWFDQLNTSTNFEEFSFLYHGSDDYDNSIVGLDNLWPFTENYSLANYLVDTSRTNFPNLPWGSTNFNFVANFATNIPAPPILNQADPYWILQLGFALPYPPYYSGNTTDWGVTLSSTNTVASLQSGIYNLFDLPYETGCMVDGTGLNPTTGYPAFPPVYQPLGLGGTITAMYAPTNGYHFGIYASQCPAPTLNPVSYYFAPLSNPNLNTKNLPSVGRQPFPLPIDDAFNVTNQTPPIIVGTVGQPMILGGWAKYSIQNGASGKYAYLGQYFVTNAFLLDTSGNTTTNIAGILSPYGEFFPLQAGVAALVTMPDIDPPYQQGTGVVKIVSMNADANHDGTLDLSYSGPDQTSSSRPFRFWVNDNQDAGDYGGNSGVPGLTYPQADGQNNLDWNLSGPIYHIHGTRDLVDFFPVYLNIGSLFQSNALSDGISATDTNYQFVLSQADGALRFAYTDLTPANYMNFLRDTNEAIRLGDAPDPGLWAGALLTTITASGVALSNSFVCGIATNNQGIILVEAWKNTTRPLVLTIYHGTNQIAQTQLYLSISGVEQMFRSKTMMLNPEPGEVPDRLTDASVPNEPDTIAKNFVFVHGYNVNPKQARGWNADIYKRLYWSGSHAKFWAVTWEAADSQVASAVTINLQTNIVNAFNTASAFATFLATLTNGPTAVAAHSLGNMVVLSALNDYNVQNINTYFMIDAAVPIEAIQGNATPDSHMYYPDWIPYADKLNAGHWWQLFSTNDARSTLTWNNRLANFGSATVYNFYSSGEEVLREYTNSTGGYPPSELESAGDQVIFYLENELFNIGKPVGTYTWAWQEMLKGRGQYDGLISSTHGGWKFNTNAPYAYVTNGVVTQIPNSQATLTPNSQLQTNAFFDATSPSFGTADLALFGASGSTYAQAHRNRILSDAIPALTLPVGANPVSIITPPGQADRNIDMQTLKNNWPIGRTIDQGNWHHSDCRQVAYTFTHNLFDDIVTYGELQ